MDADQIVQAETVQAVSQAIEKVVGPGPAVDQLTALWKADFKLEPDSLGRLTLKGADGQSADDLISGRLELPQWSNFKPQLARDAGGLTEDQRRERLRLIHGQGINPSALKSPGDMPFATLGGR